VELVAQYQKALKAHDLKTGRELAEQLVEANEGLVVKFAMRYARANNEEDKEDAMQAGRMGLLRAARDYDPKIASFSTHAHSHIRDFVQRWSGKTVAVARPRSASMPAKIAIAAQRFRQRYGREPSASDLGVTEAQLTDWSQGTYFVEIDANADDDRPGVQVTYDEQEAEHKTRCMQVGQAWESALETLSPRNRDIAERVFLNGEQKRAVGISYGLEHSRIAQICKRIEIRLRRVLDPASYNPAEDWDRKAAVKSARWRESRQSA
jgi:RNA polymerase sigma factor (sigma-70 family)